MREKGWRKLYGNRLLVRPDEIMVSSIIATPDSVQAPRAESGVIVQIGHLVSEMYFPVGQRVAFTPHAGITANLGDESLLVITPSEVMGFVDDEPEVSDGAPV